MTESIPLPMAYGLRLRNWRPHQYETVKAIGNSDKKYVVVEATTGSGKSASGAALAKELGKIRILTKSRSLQDQYADHKYDAKVLYGMAAYPCAMVPGFTADQCVFPGNMGNCPRVGACQYLRAKEAMLESSKQVISYAYWFTAGWLKIDPSPLYFDEAHEIPAFTMNYLEKEFNRKWSRYFRIALPNFPDTDNQTVLRLIFIKFCERANRALIDEKDYMTEKIKEESGDPDMIRRLVHIEREAEQLGVILHHVKNRPDEMMIIIKKDNEFTVAPLTSRMFRWFLNQHGSEKTVFTSATIGNQNTFMGSIGFAKNEFDYIDVPSQFPAESMPVYIPDDAPKISYKSSEEDLQHQAQMIANIILQCPESWSGFVHTASRAQSLSIASRLAHIDPSLARRVWVPEPGSSSSKIESWQTRKMLCHNTIAVSWDFWTGLDAFYEEINIIAKIPFNTLDVLGSARMKMDQSFYLWEAACKVEQAAGRNRRGEPDHYEVAGQPTRRICAIVDKNVYRVYNEFGSLFKQRIEAVRGKNVEIRR